MTPPHTPLSDQEVGERLRLARETAGLTQAHAANIIDAARTTLLAIEKGQRRIRTDELQKLTHAYGTSANAILRREAVQLDLVPRFRKLKESKQDAVIHAGQILNDLVSAEVELEEVLGIQRVQNYPPERPLLPGNVEAQAEQDAQELRDWLGLGPGPLADLMTVLDLHMGVRVYSRPLDSKVSGLFAFDKAVGACMLLNANHPRTRLQQTLVHELAHFISTRREPEVLTESVTRISREERYANCFARCFLTPARAVRQQFARITEGQSHLTRRHVILLAHAFGVSREAMVRRLEELDLARDGTWDWFQANGGITDNQARQVLGDLEGREAYLGGTYQQIPPRVALLAREAWKLGIYSEGQLSRLLRIDRRAVRDVLDSTDTEGEEADELFKLPR